MCMSTCVHARDGCILMCKRARVHVRVRDALRLVVAVFLVLLHATCCRMMLHVVCYARAASVWGVTRGCVSACVGMCDHTRLHSVNQPGERSRPCSARAVAAGWRTRRRSALGRGRYASLQSASRAASTWFCSRVPHRPCQGLQQAWMSQQKWHALGRSAGRGPHARCSSSRNTE